MKKRIWVIVAVLVAIAIAASFGIYKYKTKNTSSKTTPIAVIQINAKSFLPAVLKINSGTRVTWINNDSAPHKIGANPYPEHTDLPGLISGDIGPLETYSYTFTKTGNYGYHDELNPSINGTITVY